MGDLVRLGEPDQETGLNTFNNTVTIYDDRKLYDGFLNLWTKGSDLVAKRLAQIKPDSGCEAGSWRT